jgi:hypothetical protein
MSEEINLHDLISSNTLVSTVMKVLTGNPTATEAEHNFVLTKLSSWVVMSIAKSNEDRKLYFRTIGCDGGN